jgi:catechol 2,3-dioxygenase-like lactoylglutathione lyase family enzyme
MQVDHASLVVSNLERSLEWWERVVGADCGRPLAVPDLPTVAALVALGDAGIRLVEAPAQASAPFALANDRIGAMHVCLGVPDMNKAHGRLQENGVTPSTPPRELVPGVWSLYFRDPDGIQLQLIQAGDRLGLHHVAYNVSDLETTLSWYGSTFGLVATHRSTASGTHIAEMLETANASYSVALLPIGETLLELMHWDTWTPPLARRRTYDHGAWHIAVTVDDVAATQERLEVRVEPEVRSGRRVLACHDPDGFPVHVLEATTT